MDVYPPTPWRPAGGGAVYFLTILILNAVPETARKGNRERERQRRREEESKIETNVYQCGGAYNYRKR